MIKRLKFFIPFLVLCLLWLPTASAAGVTVAPPAGGKVIQNPKVPDALQPKDDGQIQNVSFSPPYFWYTGQNVHVNWEWPGYIGYMADVSLWNGSTKAATVITSWGKTTVGWVVPYDLPQGNYTVKVESTRHPANFAEKTLLIYSSKVDLDPLSSTLWAPGSTYPISWTSKGYAGPLKLELVPAAGGSPLLITASVANGGGEFHGRYDWKVPDTLATGNYVIKATSLASSAIVSTRPVTVTRSGITVVAPAAGTKVNEGASVTIKWNYAGNVGTAVNITAKATLSGQRTLATNLPIGANGSGEFTSWLITLDSGVAPGVGEPCTITVQSVQNPAISGSVTVTQLGKMETKTKPTKTKDTGSEY